MIKKTFTVLLLAVFMLPLFVLAQENVTEEKKKIADDSQRTLGESVRLFDNTQLTVLGDPIGVSTTYDYFSNSVIRDQIVYDLGLGTPHFANMIENDPNFSTEREIVHTYNDGSGWVNQSVDPGARHGWPHIDLALTGSALGTVGIVHHVPCVLSLWDGSTGYITSEFDPDSDPSFQFSGENIFLGTSGNRVQFQFFLSADFGVSYTNWDSIGSYHPTPIYWTDNGGVELGMSKSPDEQTLLMFGTNVGEGHVYDPVDPDSADNVWAVYSMDAGATWTGQTFGRDGVINLVTGYHTANYAPLFENFGQVDMAVGNDGVMHAVANGYGLVFDDPIGTTNIGDSYPILYWNSTTDTWVAISDESVDTTQAIGDFYPGNDIGQSTPSIAVSEDGMVVYAVWCGPQFTAGVMDTANGFFMTDLYHAFSTDGGTTWTYGGTLSDDAVISEKFGTLGQHLRVDGTNLVGDIVYQADQSAGVNVFGEGDQTNNDIMYATFVVSTVGVGDPVTTVNSFNLEQNYPNPFNPSTTINYSIAERSNVSIKVYDVLGNEVAKLVNTTQDAGKHSIQFDASNIASGLYIYTIRASNFTSSKKMMLLK